MTPSQAEQAISRKARVRRNTQLSPVIHSPVSVAVWAGKQGECWCGVPGCERAEPLITPQTLKTLETIKTVLSGFIVVPVALVGFAVILGCGVIAELWDRNSF